MKAWLGDNLSLNVQVYPLNTANWTILDALQREGMYAQPVVGFSIESKLTIAGETMFVNGTTFKMPENEVLIHHQLSQNVKMKQRLEMLEQENAQLKRRLDLLENPLPL